jgi:hypothetical protein
VERQSISGPIGKPVHDRGKGVRKNRKSLFKNMIRIHLVIILDAGPWSWPDANQASPVRAVTVSAVPDRHWHGRDSLHQPYMKPSSHLRVGPSVPGNCSTAGSWVSAHRPCRRNPPHRLKTGLRSVAGDMRTTLLAHLSPTGRACCRSMQSIAPLHVHTTRISKNFESTPLVTLGIPPRILVH